MVRIDMHSFTRDIIKKELGKPEMSFIKSALAGLRNCLFFSWMLPSADSTKYYLSFAVCKISRFPQFYFLVLNMDLY